MRLLLKTALLLPLVLLPVLAMAARPGHIGGIGGHGGFGGPTRIIRGPVYRPHYYSSFGLGVGVGFALGYPFYGYPYYGSPYYYGSPQEVIVERNTYIEPSDSTTTVIREAAPAPRASGTSLLRDLQGHCYRRTYDQNGNEQRTELDPAMCNF